MSEKNPGFAEVVERRYQAVLGVTRALGLPDPKPGSEVAYFLMQSSTAELQAMRRKILSQQKVVYLYPDQSAKSS